MISIFAEIYPMSTAEVILLIISGLMVGFINTLAGGGSIISLSVLIMLGLPATLANGTNRIAIMLQTLVATGSFRHQKVLDSKKGLWLGIPSVLGSVLGARIAVDIKEDLFEKAIAVILLVMLVIILMRPKRWLFGNEELVDRKVSLSQVIIFFLIGVYGGFLHVGVGYFLLAAIVLGAGYDLVRANAIKVLIVLLYSPFALMVFLLHGQVRWDYGLIMAIGNVTGALIASRMAVSKGAAFVRWVMIVLILVTSADLLNILDIRGLVSAII